MAVAKNSQIPTGGLTANRNSELRGTAKVEGDRVVLTFERYEVVIELSPMRVVEIRIRKDFLSDDQRRKMPQRLDVDRFYQD
jgi:hypothetical protein